MTAFLLGTAAALFWGIGDFLVRGVSARLGTAGALFFSHLLLLPVLGASALVLGLGPAVQGAQPWLLGLGGAVLNLLMVVTIYKALHHGPLPVVAPIIASYSAVTTLLALATGTDTLRPATGLCLLIIFAGVLLSVIERHEGSSSPRRVGIIWALMSTLFSGALTFAQGSAILPVLGEIRALLLNAGIVLAASAVLLVRSPASLPPRAIDAQTVGLGLCMGAGFLAFFFGLGTGEIVVVSVLSSMCGAITALLGALVAKQPTSKLQWGGGGLILAGVVALKLA